MKQLILNFLFFVAFATILVACARFFPSEEKTDYPTSIKSADDTIDKTIIKVNEKPVIPGKTTFIRLYQKQNIPANKIVKVNGYPIIYNPNDNKENNLASN